MPNTRTCDARHDALNHYWDYQDGCDSDQTLDTTPFADATARPHWPRFLLYISTQSVGVTFSFAVYVYTLVYPGRHHRNCAFMPLIADDACCRTAGLYRCDLIAVLPIAINTCFRRVVVVSHHRLFPSAATRVCFCGTPDV